MDNRVRHAALREHGAARDDAPTSWRASPFVDRVTLKRQPFYFSHHVRDDTADSRVMRGPWSTASQDAFYLRAKLLLVLSIVFTAGSAPFTFPRPHGYGDFPTMPEFM